MRRLTLGSAGLLWFSLAAAAAAQGADEAILLRYRFQPGQEFRYRMTLTGDMGMTMNMGGLPAPAAAAMPGRIPMTLNGTYEWVQKVKSVSPDGVATISLGLNKMDLSTGVMGMNVTVRMGEGRKIETLMNGQPMAGPGEAAQALPDPLFEATLDPTGKVSTNVEAAKSMNQLFGGNNFSAMFNGSMPGMGMLILPEKPIRPGETWETKTSLQVPVAMPGPAGGALGGPAAGGTLPVSYTVQNKLASVEDGRAVIETRLSTSIPPGTKMQLPAGPGAPPGMAMALEKLDQSMTGSQRFDVAQGTIEGGDFDVNLDMAMAMGLPPGVPDMTPAPAPKAGAKPPAKKPAPAKKSTAKTSAARPQTPAAKAGSTAARPVSAPPATPPAPAAGAPGSLKIGMGGTAKIKLDRLPSAEAAPPPAPPIAP